jgi:serine/threonine protein kinase
MTDKEIQRMRRIVEEPDLAGTRYRLIEQIARGGMGAVWEAEDIELGRRVALKVLPVWDANSSELLLREARILARLEHPGIVPVHDAGTLGDGRVFYAMKLVQGERLDQAKERMSRAELLRLFQRICEPVSFAHSRSVVHRDLKPENVMVGEFGEVLVMDWGIAKLQGAGKEQGIIGTPDYMAPEQAAGENDRVDQRSDVYGLGGILQFLMTGHSIPKPLAAIRAKALAQNPDARYTSAAALAVDVGRFIDGDPVSVYRENVVEIAQRWVSRHETLVLLVLAYLLMRALLLYFLGR